MGRNAGLGYDSVLMFSEAVVLRLADEALTEDTLESNQEVV